MLIIACILSGTVGALGMAILSVGTYDKGYEDGVEDAMNNGLSKTIHRTK